MKKLLFSIFLILIFFSIGCEDSNTEMTKDPFIESVNCFIEDLDGINQEYLTTTDFLNYDNPLENLYLVFDQEIIDQCKKKKNTKGSDLEYLFSEEFLSSFPTIEPSSLNEDTYYILTKMDEIFLTHSTNECVSRLKLIENYIDANRNLNLDYSDLLLSYSTALRHILIIHDELLEGKGSDPSWKECMFEKARKLQKCDNCYIEKAYFTFTFPLSFAIWAADCGIDQII